MRDGIYCIQFPRDLATVDRVWSEAINQLGKESARAQGLDVAITSTIRLSSTRVTDTVYIIVDDGEGIGLLRIGRRKLFLTSPNAGGLSEYNPLCVLDFYTRRRRKGHGRELFCAMLGAQGVSICSLAFDRPSSDMKSFLKKVFGIDGISLQPNRFAIVWPDFHSPQPTDPTRLVHSCIIRI